MENHISSSILDKNPGKWNSRILIGTPMTGLVRSEWVHARYGQLIPTNWSHIEVIQWMGSHIPLQYQTVDAENIIAKQVVERNFEWLLFIEHDNIIPPQTFVKFNDYMLAGDIPVISGLYFTKSVPPEPMVYRDFGKSYYTKWKLGDKVWARGIPFGCCLIHGSLIRALWNESPEYVAGNTVTRRVFKQPNESFLDPETSDYLMASGTTDLKFCEEVVQKKIFAKAGWPKYQAMKYPFLIDTNLFVKHIDQDGTQYPIEIPQQFLKNGHSNGKR